MARCKSCEAEIMWVRMLKADGSRGKAMPLDAEHDGIRLVRFGKNGDLCKAVRVYKSHFATCPYAKEHREK